MLTMTRWQDLAARITADPHRCRLHGRINIGVDMAELLIFLLGIFVGASLGVFLMALAIASRDDDDIR